MKKTLPTAQQRRLCHSSTMKKPPAHPAKRGSIGNVEKHPEPSRNRTHIVVGGSHNSNSSVAKKDRHRHNTIRQDYLARSNARV